MAGTKWTRVAAKAELADGKPVGVEVDGATVLLVRRGGQIHACGGKCTHHGAPLAEGVLVGDEITCPWHTARFDVTTGRMLAPPALDDEPKYEVKVKGREVYVGKATFAPSPRPRKKDPRTFAIVGGGAAGNAAAETLRREGFAGRVVMITQEKSLPYDRPMLSKGYLAGDAKAAWLPLRDKDFYEENQIEVLTGRRVVGLAPADRTLSFAKGKPMKADALLLATGSVPRRLAIPGADLEGCFLLRSLADAKALVAAAKVGSRAVLLGASFIGLEAAASLRSRGLEVHVVAPESVPMERVFGQEVGRFLQKLHEEKGVVFHLGQSARELVGLDRGKAVVLADGTRVEGDLVLVGVGVTPAIECLAGTGLAENGAVPVDGCLRTRADGVFAAGDIAAVPDARTGEPRRIEHWTVAERQGIHAARAMLGSQTPYDEVPFFWTKQYDASIKYLGYAARYDRVALRGSMEKGKFVAGYYAGGTLKAVAALGLSRDAILLGQALKAGRPVAPEQLADAGLDLAKLLE